MPRIIAFEGVSGAGKTTCCRIVSSILDKRGLNILRINEKEHEPLRSYISAWHNLPHEEKLFTARKVKEIAECRAEVHASLADKISASNIVIFDRSVWTSMVYQSFDGQQPEAILSANECAGAIVPSEIFLFMADPVLCARRVIERAKRRSTYGLPATIEDHESILRSYEQYRKVCKHFPTLHHINGQLSIRKNVRQVLRLLDQ